MGRFFWITIYIGLPCLGAWTGTLKNPTKCLWHWEPDRRSNFFFSLPAHLFAVTYQTPSSAEWHSLHIIIFKDIYNKLLVLHNDLKISSIEFNISSVKLKILQMNYISKCVEHINFCNQIKAVLKKAIFNLFEDIFTITKDIHSSMIVIN